MFHLKQPPPMPLPWGKILMQKESFLESFAFLESEVHYSKFNLGRTPNQLLARNLALGLCLSVNPLVQRTQTCVKDWPCRTTTSSHHPPTTTMNLQPQPPTTTYRSPQTNQRQPPTTHHQPPTTTNHHLFNLTTNHYQSLPTTTYQSTPLSPTNHYQLPPPTTHQPPPTTTNHHHLLPTTSYHLPSTTNYHQATPTTPNHHYSPPPPPPPDIWMHVLKTGACMDISYSHTNIVTVVYSIMDTCVFNNVASKTEHTPSTEEAETAELWSIQSEF